MLIMSKQVKKRKRCHNCKFAGEQFKVNNMTHLHCEDPTKYNQETWDNEEFTAWDTLREFWSTCENHEFKIIEHVSKMQ